MNHTHPQTLLGALVLIGVLLGTVALADEFTSTDYRLLDPVMAPGSYATSSSFSLWGSFGEVGIGESASGSYGLSSAFLTFPFVSTPAVAATGGDAEVDLSWSTSQAALGFTVGSYSVGVSTSSGGPYTYSNVGLVTGYTDTGLTNDTTYYFVVTVHDAFGNGIATSTEVSATPAGSAPPSGGGGGGGGGGSDDEEEEEGESSITVSGSAYPESTVIFYLDGRERLRTVSGPDAKFTFTDNNLSAGSYSVSIVAIDPDRRRSPAYTVSVRLPESASTSIGGVFLAPSLDTDYETVRRGDTITLFGVTVPEAAVSIEVNSEETLFFSSSADGDGAYLVQFNSGLLELGKHTAKSKAQAGNQVSPYGHAVSFQVGDETEARAGDSEKGDINGDSRVNLYDFSVAAYWYRRALSGDIIAYERDFLSGDGKIDLVDFSIIAYYWTN